MASGTLAANRLPLRSSRGFVLIFALLLLMGVGGMAVAMMFNARHGQVTGQNYKHRIRAFYVSDGMRSLLAQEVMDGKALLYVDSTRHSEIDGEVWDGAGTMSRLRSSLGRTPSRRVKSYYLGSHWSSPSNYGVRWSGYLLPPISGPYTFLVRSDGEAAFHLSTDESHSRLSRDPIAHAESQGFEWPRRGDGVSRPIVLKAGQRYFFEFLHARSGGDGFGQVGWNGPNYLVERPIAKERLESRNSPRVVWDTVALDKGSVRYAVKEAGLLTYVINSEAVLGGPSDTSFRAPLDQTLSLLGPNPAPPESLWQRVILYDFRADRSNPEFEMGKEVDGVYLVNTDMVRRKGLRYTTENASWFGLDSIGKPMLGTKPWRNCGIEHWFKPWRPGWYKTYRYAGGTDDCRESDAATDGAFQNHVYKDSLLFLRRGELGVNAYQFRRFTSLLDIGAFTPLDGRGFGNEVLADLNGIRHNYSFCMEIHTRYEHTSGLQFQFTGDDDTWLFINDSLVMDLGGVHGSATGSVNLDDLPLEFGQLYPLDFFYCERETFGSSIDLITNLPIVRKPNRTSGNWERGYGNRD